MTRAHRSLIILTVLTILAGGLLAQALAGPAGIGADVQVGVSSLLLIASATLLIRVLRHLSRSSGANQAATAIEPDPSRRGTAASSRSGIARRRDRAHSA